MIYLIVMIALYKLKMWFTLLNFTPKPLIWQYICVKVSLHNAFYRGKNKFKDGNILENGDKLVIFQRSCCCFLFSTKVSKFRQFITSAFHYFLHKCVMLVFYALYIFFLHFRNTLLPSIYEENKLEIAFSRAGNFCMPVGFKGL